MAGSLGGIATLLLLAFCSRSVVIGQVTTTTPNQDVKENASVDFVCTANFASPKWRWKFQDKEGSKKLVFIDEKFTDDYASRATLTGTGIRINGVTRKDTGEYTCDATGANNAFGEATMKLTVQVPPSTPVMQVPTSVTTGSEAVLRCIENDGSPPSTFKWFKNKTLMPENPKSLPMFQNSSYTLDPKSGVLHFSTTTKDDIGDYYCEASNPLGSASSKPVLMEIHDTNVGGIVAAVVIVLLILALIGVGLWFAYSRGYIGKKSGIQAFDFKSFLFSSFSTGKKVIYSTPSETRSDRNFQQTSSFVV
ncbi:junctional adhesion molecule A [Pleurodeles waltl]|uniref:junctional adhesion molecule A n=1 Tax=Pleurodeles waltl TaxID=8319 RepID=UPI0037093B19